MKSKRRKLMTRSIKRDKPSRTSMQTRAALKTLERVDSCQRPRASASEECKRRKEEILRGLHVLVTDIIK
jgi:hypothetical protein